MSQFSLEIPRVLFDSTAFSQILTQMFAISRERGRGIWWGEVESFRRTVKLPSGAHARGGLITTSPPVARPVVKLPPHTPLLPLVFPLILNWKTERNVLFP